MDKLMPIPSVKNRRPRDYWIFLIGGNFVLFLGFDAIGGPAVAGMMSACVTAGIIWIMHGIMDRH